MGAELATINDAAEKDQVLNLMEYTVWIGLKDIKVEGTFVWQDGSSPSDYQKKDAAKN